MSNHTLLPDQQEDARHSFGIKEFVELPPSLREGWSAIPAEEDELTGILAPLKEWLQQESLPDDVILVQGEPGATFLLIDGLLQTGRRPVQATRFIKVLLNVKLQQHPIVHWTQGSLVAQKDMPPSISPCKEQESHLPKESGRCPAHLLLESGETSLSRC